MAEEACAVVDVTIKGNEMRHTIAVVRFGRSKYIAGCLESIAKNTAVEHEVFVVNTKKPHIALAAGWNQGVRMGTGEFCTVLNDDTLVSLGWLRRLEAGLLDDPTIGCVGPTLSACWGQQNWPFVELLPGVGPDNVGQDGVDEFSKKLAIKYAGERIPVKFLSGCCLTFRRSLFEQLDGFDEDFFPIYGEDDDWADRVIAAGYKCIWVKDAYVHHFYRKTLSRIPVNQKRAKAMLAKKRKERAERIAQ